MFKFIHAADLHLDSPLKGLEKYENAPVDEIRGAARRAFENLVDLAIEETVAFVLIAGDLYDGDWNSYDTGYFFLKQASRLHDAQIPLLLIAGNHDAQNKMTRSLTLPPNTTMFSADAPQSLRLDDFELAVHGQSYATQAVTIDLAERYPAPDSGLFNVGMLHTSASGNESREGHHNYAPCSVESLKLKGYDYWALGHIHQRETLAEAPFVGFSGNIQGRHAKETGAKGCLLVTVNHDRSVTPEFRELDTLRWEVVTVDASQAHSTHDVIDLVRDSLDTAYQSAGGKPLAARVVIEGASAAHRALHHQKQHIIAEIRGQGIVLSGGRVWVEKIKLNTREPRREQNTSLSEDALGSLTALFAEAHDHPELLEEWGFELNKVQKKLPGELKSAVAIDGERLSEVLRQAEARLLHDLFDAEEAE